MRFVKYGFVVVLVHLILAGASFAENLTKPNVLSSNNGRYVFGQLSDDYASPKFMLDTKTGRLWQAVEDSNGRLLKLQVVPYGRYSHMLYMNSNEHTIIPPIPEGFVLDKPVKDPNPFDKFDKPKKDK